MVPDMLFSGKFKRGTITGVECHAAYGAQLRVPPIYTECLVTFQRHAAKVADSFKASKSEGEKYKLFLEHVSPPRARAEGHKF